MVFRNLSTDDHDSFEPILVMMMNEISHTHELAPLPNPEVIYYFHVQNFHFHILVVMDFPLLAKAQTKSETK